MCGDKCSCCDIRDVRFDDMSGSGAKPKADKSARLYALRDGLSQISWLCEVLEEYVTLEKALQWGDTIVAMNRHSEILSGIQERLAARFKGSYAGPKDYKCFDVLSKDMRTFADATLCDPAWVDDEWGIQFLELLEDFNTIFNGAITIFLNACERSATITEDLDRLHASTTEMEEKLAALLRFVYDWKTKMTTSPKKRRIQGDDAWTNLCYQCVWITTSFPQTGNLGALGALYADCIKQKEVLNRDMQAYVLESQLDGKNEIYNRRDDTQVAGAAAVAKKTANKGHKKARSDEYVQRPKWRNVQMTALLGDLQKVCV